MFDIICIVFQGGRMEIYMRFAFYISGKSTRLLHYLTHEYRQSKPDISVIVSEYKVEDRLNKILKELGIPVSIFEYKNLKGINNKEKNLELSEKIMNKLDYYEVDYCFSFGSHILSGQLLKKYEYHLINFHPSLLPMFSGQNAIDQAVEAKNIFLVGNTAHFIDNGIDTGKIIMQSVIPIQNFFDSSGNYDSVLNLQTTMLDQLIGIINDNRLNVEGDRVRIQGADYAKSHIYPFIDDTKNLEEKKLPDN